jgi:hypothetical protein
MDDRKTMAPGIPDPFLNKFLSVEEDIFAEAWVVECAYPDNLPNGIKKSAVGGPGS